MAKKDNFILSNRDAVIPIPLEQNPPVEATENLNEVQHQVFINAAAENQEAQPGHDRERGQTKLQQGRSTRARKVMKRLHVYGIATTGAKHYLRPVGWVPHSEV